MSATFKLQYFGWSWLPIFMDTVASFSVMVFSSTSYMYLSVPPQRKLLKILPVFCQLADTKFDSFLFSVDSGWCIGRVYFLSSAGQSS